MKKLDLIFLSTAKHATHHMQLNFVDTDLDTERSNKRCNNSLI